METWFAISGYGKLLIDKTVHLLYPFAVYQIPIGIVHQVKNHGEESLVILEVQEGTYCEEDDIMRLQEAWTENESK